MLAAWRGELDEVERLTSSALHLNQIHQGGTFVLSHAQHARGLAALSTGDCALAFEHLRVLLEPDHLASHYAISSWAVGDLADAARRSGHEVEARRLLANLPALSEHDARPTAGTVSMHLARALLADGDDVDAEFDRAFAQDLRRWPLDRGRLHLAHGERLRRLRRSVEARAPLAEALRSFESVGATAWAERARQELRAAGVTTSRAGSSRWDDLTAQEQQIARLAAQGHTNRQIAQQLYLSHRTVGAHLYRVFPKLGITSRGHLAAVVPSARIDDEMTN
jgi:DNA-binding CsgD family transcriptional regulator